MSLTIRAAKIEPYKLRLRTANESFAKGQNSPSAFRFTTSDQDMYDLGDRDSYSGPGDYRKFSIDQEKHSSPPRID
jgi:hypothetical protein